MRPLFVFLALCLLPGSSLAQVKWFPHKSDEFKIQVCLNTGMKVKASRHGKWGVLAAKEGDVNIVIMALKGTATFAQMQQVAEKVSKIPGSYWKAVKRGKAWNGFGEHGTYLAEATDRVLIGFLAKHGKYIDRNYIVFVSTSKKNFVEKKAVFNAWGKCLQALP